MSNLRELATLAIEHQTRHGHFPPGMEQRLYDFAPQYRGTSLFVHLLSGLGRQDIRSGWDFRDPLKNTEGAAAARTATVVDALLCPADIIPANPVNDGRWVYALTSYGGNGGTRTHPPQQATADGMFCTTGSGSEPIANQQPVTLRHVSDGQQHTILLGERLHFDPGYESFVAKNWGSALSSWGWWAASAGRKNLAHVTMSSLAPINFAIGFTHDGRSSASPAASTNVQFQYFVDRRLTSFGSAHPGGANFAMVDGSVRFLSEEMPQPLLQALCTRSGNDGAAGMEHEE